MPDFTIKKSNPWWSSNGSSPNFIANQCKAIKHLPWLCTQIAYSLS
jgi:hypothetical protein